MVHYIASGFLPLKDITAYWVTNNNRCIELQMINRFVVDGLIRNVELPMKFRQELESHFSFSQPSLVSSLADTVRPQSSTSLQSEWMFSNKFVLPSHRSWYNFNDEELEEIGKLLSRLYSVSLSSLQFSRSCWKYQIQDKQIGSYQSRSRPSSIVMANWNSDLFEHILAAELEEPEQTSHSNLLKPARVNYFLLHDVVINDTPITHLFVSLSWYKCHSRGNSLGKPLSLWCGNSFELQCYAPVQFLKHRTVSHIIHETNAVLIIICPCVESII